MALSGTITGKTNNKYINVKIEWSATQDVENNRSRVTAKVLYKRNNSGYYTEGNWRGTITINGSTSSYVNEIHIGWQEWEQAGSKSINVTHNTDGTKSISISATGYINGTSLDSTTISGTIELDKILRKATLTAAPNFNDEGNPTITYSNPAGNAVAGLAACISFDGSNPDIAYRDISKTGTTYTFNLTAAERKILRQGTKTANSRSIKFYVRTTIGGDTYYSSLSKTFSIVNAAPTLNPTAVDTNASTIALTGNNNSVVRHCSIVNYAANAAALKEATIKSYKIVCGTKTQTTATGNFTNAESNILTFTVTDSRGNTTTKTVEKTNVPYVKPTCNMAIAAPTTDGKTSFTVSGNFYNGSFGSTANTLTVQYRYSTDGGAYGAWTAINITKTNNTYKGTVNISGLDYRSSYVFQARAYDAIQTATTPAKTVKTAPVFDWSADDFKFNVPVTFNNGYKNFNNTLWSGKQYMNGSQNITLPQPVSEQPNGIVLVFSNYDASTSTANNYDWHCFFVPKALVAAHDGSGHTFNMMSQAFGDIASKYVYISDTNVSGNDVNTTNGTRNGITYNNAKYVLRYIYGV